jgi:hypothetical protein
LTDSLTCALQHFKEHHKYTYILKIRIFNILVEKRRKTIGAMAFRHKPI